MLVTLTKKNLQIIGMEFYDDSDSFTSIGSDSDSDSDNIDLDKKNKKIYNKLKELLKKPINEDSTAQIIELLDAIDPNNKWGYKSIELIDETEELLQEPEIIKSIVGLIKNIDPNTEYGYYSLYDILLIIENNKKNIDDNVYNQFKADIVDVINNIGANSEYESKSIKLICNIKELLQEPEIIKSIVGLIKNIDPNTEYGYYSLYDILLIIENNKKDIDDNVYNQFKADIVPILKNIDPNTFSKLYSTNTRSIVIFNYLQAIKKIDDNVYDELKKNIFNCIKNIPCTTSYQLLKLLMTDLIENEKLIQKNVTSIQKNKTLIQENKTLILKNVTLIQKNVTLIQKNVTLIEENKTLILKNEKLREKHKTLMKDILYLMKQRNRNAIYNEYDTKELLDFMIDKKLIHNERLKKELSKEIQKIDMKDFHNICILSMSQNNRLTIGYITILVDLKTYKSKKKLCYKDKSYLKEILCHINDFLSEIQNKNFESIGKNETINSTEESVQHKYQKQNIDLDNINKLNSLILITGRMHPTQSNTTSSNNQNTKQQ